LIREKERHKGPFVDSTPYIHPIPCGPLRTSFCGILLEIECRTLWYWHVLE
jgi:hypothetical protein